MLRAAGIRFYLRLDKLKSSNRLAPYIHHKSMIDLNWIVNSIYLYVVWLWNIRAEWIYESLMKCFL